MISGSSLDGRKHFRSSFDRTLVSVKGIGCSRMSQLKE